MSATDDYYAERSRSYVVRDQFKAGRILTANRDLDRSGIKAGDEVVVIDFANAGFSGIVVHVRTADGKGHYHLPAGAFTVGS